MLLGQLAMFMPDLAERKHLDLSLFRNLRWIASTLHRPESFLVFFSMRGSP